jgi:5-methylcytosine-specific restriction endonuclease McrA
MDEQSKLILLQTNNTIKNSKKINCEKEKKMRLETKTWGFTEEELDNEIQLNALFLITDTELEKDKYRSSIISHIKTKISGYRQQDVFKKKLEESKFVSFNEVVKLLQDCFLKCHYCSQDIYILYERVREMKQWSLDRIDNNLGHNSGNLVVACLECNLKRRRTNKDAFMFTKNLVITREGL